MTDSGSGEMRDWLKWIAGGLIAFMIVFWQWVDRKIDALRDRTRDDRHDLAGKVQSHLGKIDDELKDHGERIARLERNGHKP